MSIVAWKKIPSKEVHIAFSDGEISAKTRYLPLLKSIDHGDKHGLPLDVEYHFAMDGERTLIIHLTEHVFSDMRKVATVQRLRELIDRRSEPRTIMIREKRKKPSWWRGSSRGLGSQPPRMVDISDFTSEAIIARMGIKLEEDEEEEA